MSQELQACPHCGAALPYVRDAFCSECRTPLDELPADVAGSNAAASGILVTRPGPLRLGSLLPFNVAAVAIVAVSFLPALGICRLLGDDRDGTKLAIGGPLALVIDLVFRFRSPLGDLWLPGRGGKFLYLPVWVFAIFWSLYGLWQLLS